MTHDNRFPIEINNTNDGANAPYLIKKVYATFFQVYSSTFLRH